MNAFNNVRPLAKAVALTAQEEAVLARKAKAGDKQAVNTLIMANMKHCKCHGQKVQPRSSFTRFDS